jgi:hypothetical protein
MFTLNCEEPLNGPIAGPPLSVKNVALLEGVHVGFEQFAGWTVTLTVVLDGVLLVEMDVGDTENVH